MSALPDPHNWTVAQYLDYERTADARHEFVHGEITAMAGASERHNQIASALNYLLYGQLIARPCQVFQSDMRVRVTADMYFYPDIAVVCDEATYVDDRRDTLTNPTTIIEVLSPSTEDYDRGRKFARYRQLASLRDYLLVAQSEMRVEHHSLRPGEGWLLRDFTAPDAPILIPSLDCTLALSDIYRKVTF